MASTFQTYSRESKSLKENGDNPLVVVGSACLLMLGGFLIFFLYDYYYLHSWDRVEREDIMQHITPSNLPYRHR